MKVTKSQLKQIIKEEIIKEAGGVVGNIGGKSGGLGSVAGRKGQELDKADHSEYGPEQLAEDSLVGLLTDLGHTLVEWEQKEYRSDEVRYKSYFQDIQKLLEEYDPCAHPDQKCDEVHPGQTHEECIEVTINKDLYEVYSKKQRRWACAQKDKSAKSRKKGLSKKEAEEMCTGPMKHKRGKK
jgi:hypothetical protein